MDPRDYNGMQMPQMAGPPPMMNPPPQIFGGGGGAYDGLPINMADLSQPLYGDGGLMDESIEAKRRRIARVSDATILSRTWSGRADGNAGLRYV